jgi:hypothetical protein
VPGDLLGLADLRGGDLDAGGERKVGRVGEQLVVFDEIDRGPREVPDDRPELLLPEADVRFDDGPDQRALRGTDRAPRPRNPERRAGVGGDELGGQRQLLEPARGQLAELEEVARRRREQGGDVGADVLHRELDADAGGNHLGGRTPRRQRRRPGADRNEIDHPGAEALAELVAFPRHGGEGAAGLLAGYHGRRVGGVGGLDGVDGGDPARVTHRCSSCSVVFSAWCWASGAGAGLRRTVRHAHADPQCARSGG